MEWENEQNEVRMLRKTHEGTIAIKLLGATQSSLDRKKVLPKTSRLKDITGNSFRRRVDADFGFWKLLLILLVLLVLWSLALLYPTNGMSRVSSRLANCLSLYSVIVRIWNVHSSLQASIVTMLLYGDRYPMMHSSPDSHFTSMAQHFRAELIPQLESFLNKDLGEYSEVFNRVAGSLRMCDRVMNKDLLLYTNCGVGALSFMNGNIVNILRQVDSILDKTYLTYKAAPVKQKALAMNLFRDPSFKAYFFYGGVLESSGIGVVAEVYYSVLTELAKSIETIVRPYSTSQNTDTELVESFIKFGISTLILFVLLWYFVFLKLLRIPTTIFNVYFLFPLDLLTSNIWLVDRFKKKMRFR